MTSRDGYQWTESQGLQQGLPSISVIEPPTNLSDANPSKFDVIIVGAGYAGLTAARDATLAGLKVLLLEGRDRIGGRTWTSNIDGHPFETGGSWISWGQPNLWREISRYDMRDKLEIAQSACHGIDQCTLITPTSTRNMSREDRDQILESAMEKFFNVDGAFGRNIMPFPHSEFQMKEVKKLDKLSVSDRLKQIENSLTPDEHALLCSHLLLCSGGTLENSSFYEFLHWWALCNYSYECWVDYTMKYRIEAGQSTFALDFFEEALSTGNLSYRFNQRVSTIQDKGIETTVRVHNQSFQSAKVICTVPLNVLGDIEFMPPLSAGKISAIAIGHINKCTKINAECKNEELGSWSCVNYPNKGPICAFGEGTTSNGNIHVCAFGGHSDHLNPKQDAYQTIEALQRFVPMELDRIVFHNWARDEFSKGAWFFPPPGLVSTHLEDMRAVHGNIHFASADWAVGWRGFIDGAVEEGTRAAMTVIRDIRRSCRKPLP